MIWLIENIFSYNQVSFMQGKDKVNKKQKQIVDFEYIK